MATTPAWKSAGFTSAAAYQAELDRKKAGGIKLQNQGLADQFAKEQSGATATAVTVPAWKQQNFKSADEYATEIKRKKSTGQTFQNQGAADQFMKDNPNLFGNSAPVATGVPNATGVPVAAGITGVPVTAGTNTNKYTGAAATGLQSGVSPEVQEILNNLYSYTQKSPTTANDITGSDVYKQMAGVIDLNAEKAMRAGRADLAARGVLGEGSTPAAERYAQVAGEQATARGALVPELMNASNNQYQQGLNNIMNLLNSVSGAQNTGFNQGITEFGTKTPYTTLTESQRQGLPIDWAKAIGEVPKGYGGNTFEADETPTPARDYVASKGGTINYLTRGGKDIVTINGKEIDVEAVGGKVVNGKAQLPKWIIDQALGVA